MEYRLNKIDPELREKIFDQTSSGKIHSKGKLYVNKDRNPEKNSGGDNFSEELKKQAQSEKIYVKAIKVEDIQVLAIKEAESKDGTRGLIIDIKK